MTSNSTEIDLSEMPETTDADFEAMEHTVVQALMSKSEVVTLNPWHVLQLFVIKKDWDKSNLDELITALDFYADPSTYHAWSFIPDEPAGDLGSDFEEGIEGYTTSKPGKRARKALWYWREQEADPTN